jgi:hypothetical protein
MLITEQEAIILSRYNNRVRQAISDLYVKYSKEKSKYMEELRKVQTLLYNQDGNLLHNDYMALVEKEKRINKKIEELDIRIDSMDIAREVCLNAAEE